MKLLLVIFGILVASVTQAQNWIRTAGPVEDEVFDLCMDSNGILYAATKLGVNRSTDGGAHWTRPFLFPQGPTNDTLITLAVAANGNILVSRGDGLYVSSDSGSSFAPANLAGWNPLLHYVVTPTGRIIAVSAKTGMFVSDDHGVFWTDASLAGMENGDYYPMAVAASYDSILIQNAIHSYISIDNGKTWSVVAGVNKAQQLLWHPHGVWLHVSLKDGISKLVDQVWTPFGHEHHSGITYTTAITRDGEILISSPLGVHAVRNLSSWFDISSGLPAQPGKGYARISRFVEDPRNGVCYAATRTDAVWKTARLDVADPQGSPEIFTVYPNPIRTRATIDYVTHEAGLTDIVLYDRLGNIRWKRGMHDEPGQHSTQLETTNVPSGAYVLALRSSSVWKIRSVTVLK